MTCKKTILLASLMLIAFDVMIPSFAYDEIDMEKLKKLKMYSGYDKKGAWYQLYMIACERCDLTEAYLHGAKLSGAQLKSTSLYKATLSAANLSKASLIGANLSRAKLRFAPMSEALLRLAALRVA